jgi:hypothetical protein
VLIPSLSAFDPNRTFGASASALHIDEFLPPPRVMRGLTQPFCRSAPAGEPRHRITRRTLQRQNLSRVAGEESGLSAVPLSCRSGCEGEIAEIGSLIRGTFRPEDE